MRTLCHFVKEFPQNDIGIYRPPTPRQRPASYILGLLRELLLRLGSVPEEAAIELQPLLDLRGPRSRPGRVSRP